MTDADYLRCVFVAAEVNEDFTTASLRLHGDNKLNFVHRVGMRTVNSEGPLASELMAKIATFRLNSKHLDIHFVDGSRWEIILGEHARP